jgi:transcriptional regulator GlxA family with amidase domain
MGLEIVERPSSPGPVAEGWVSPPHRAIRRAQAYMRLHCQRRLALAEVAAVAHMSPFHFSRSFHRIAGVTFQDHLVRLRLRHAEHLLRRDPSAPLRRVAAQAGFGTLRNLQDHYRRFYGYPPSRGRARERPAAVPWGDEQDPSPLARETPPLQRQAEQRLHAATTGRLEHFGRRSA